MTIVHPIATEKSIRLMEAENKLIFMVDRTATKPQIKKAIPTTTSVQDLKSLAIEEGMSTLEVSGILKVLDGVTDFTEVERVLGITIFPTNT